MQHRMLDGYHISKAHMSVLLSITLDFRWTKTLIMPLTWKTWSETEEKWVKKKVWCDHLEVEELRDFKSCFYPKFICTQNRRVSAGDTVAFVHQCRNFKLKMANIKEYLSNLSLLFFLKVSLLVKWNMLFSQPSHPTSGFIKQSQQIKD